MPITEILLRTLNVPPGPVLDRIVHEIGYGHPKNTISVPRHSTAIGLAENLIDTYNATGLPMVLHFSPDGRRGVDIETPTIVHGLELPDHIQLLADGKCLRIWSTVEPHSAAEPVCRAVLLAILSDASEQPKIVTAGADDRKRRMGLA